MKEIKNMTFSQERALYNTENIRLIDCEFSGIEDGESALKESTNVEALRTTFALRYPLWHVDHFSLIDSTMTSTCRAPLWYSRHGVINNINISGVKSLRECTDIKITNSHISSEEFSWRSSDILITDSSVEGEYAFFESRNVTLNNVNFKGKYSFQYVENLEITDSILDTKDAFWHTKGAVIKNCEVIGEYLGWYSTGLTLINCTIKGTQPLCYCKDLKLIDCKMIDADLSFEYSEVEANILSDVVSIKNPISGVITVDGKCLLILENSKYPLNAKIIIKK